MFRCNGTRAGVLSAALIWCAGMPLLLANGVETGTTAVDVTLSERSFSVALLIDPAATLARLDRLAGRARAPRLTATEYLDRLGTRRAELLDHILVQFDDRVGDVRVDAVLPEPAVRGERASDASSPRVLIRLRGAIPPGVRTFSWAYDLAVASYPLTVRRAASVEAGLKTRLHVQIIEGTERSTPLNVAPDTRQDHQSAAWMALASGLLVSLVLWRARERVAS